MSQKEDKGIQPSNDSQKIEQEVQEPNNSNVVKDHEKKNENLVTNLEEKKPENPVANPEEKNKNQAMNSGEKNKNQAVNLEEKKPENQAVNSEEKNENDQLKSAKSQKKDHDNKSKGSKQVAEASSPSHPQSPANEQKAQQQNQPENSDFNQALAERYAARRLQLIKNEAKSLLIFIWPLVISMTISAIIALIIRPTLRETLIQSVSVAYGQNNATAGTAISIVVIIATVIVLTSVLVFLIYKGWWIPVFIWIGVSLFVVGSYINMLVVIRICESLNIPVDWITVSIFCVNCGALLLVGIGWRSVPWVGNCLKIAMSVLSAITFITILPQYGIYILLVLMSIWDLIAVLPEKGPLKLLIKYVSNSDKGQRAFGALAYAGCFFLGVDHAGNNTERKEAVEKNSQDSPQDTNPDVVSDKPAKIEVKVRENRGKNKDAAATTMSSTIFTDNKGPEKPDVLAPAAFNEHDGNEPVQDELSAPSISISENSDDEGQSGGQLGLGDFVFYSVLTANLAAHTPLLGTMIVSMHLILLGLMATSMIVYIWERPLPALPISLIITVTYAVLTDFFMTPVIGTISLNNYY